ncbi:hypothetical protein JAAARDRAFT_29285 [Jaapia argillacea MUCL 33604]|uniref:O-fucosyltransferase family protein n=1 Tax=Jaapia argillacea MUCL 33604 TaxID=933084 RepID=A0A067QKW6_9AGAM|nr:hypothetical protein JAAARDRAFT_29285 [Jaapia argillacea MUCL 33604]
MRRKDSSSYIHGPMDETLLPHHEKIRRPFLSAWKQRRSRVLLAACILLTLTSAFYSSVLSFSSSLREHPRPVAVYEESDPNQIRFGSNSRTQTYDCHSPPPAARSPPQESYVLGPPTASFRDNLRNDTKYITSFGGAGMTNDVMTFANLLYLAVITERVPILPKFTAEYHIGGWDIPPIPVSEIFDLPRLRKQLGIPILEWHEVKDTDSEVLDDLGCWSVWEACNNNGEGPRWTRAPWWLNLDLSFTKAPDWICSHSQNHARFWSMAPLAYPDTHKDSLGTPQPSPEHKARLHPDEQLFCLDYLYYASVNKDFEYEFEWSPAWNHVLKQMKFTERVENLTKYYLRKALSVPQGADIPPFIALHARHGDFDGHCDTFEDYKCYPAVAEYAKYVERLQRELLLTKGIVVENHHVIMTSDEKDPRWWDDVLAAGWTRVDFKKEAVVETYGNWYPSLIDSVIQSQATGFVGVDGSTMSLIAARRVREWYGGLTTVVKWGRGHKGEYIIWDPDN